MIAWLKKLFRREAEPVVVDLGQPGHRIPPEQMARLKAAMTAPVRVVRSRGDLMSEPYGQHTGATDFGDCNDIYFAALAKERDQ